MNMQRPPKMLFFTLVKENPALPHDMQKAFMLKLLPVPLVGCPGAIPDTGFWHL